MNASVTPRDWTAAEQVSRARNLASDVRAQLDRLWILARRGEPQTDMERLIRRQVDDAMADTVEVFSELQETLEWLVKAESEAAE